MKNRGFLAVMVFAVVSSVFSSTAQAQVRISQVFGGGGVGGSALRRDFVELRNTGTVPVPIGGWSIQFAHTTLSTWQVTALPAVSISPGEFFLVAFSAGGGGTVDLPTPDATGTTNLPPVGGKVALVRSTTPLSGSGCPIDYGVVEDFVGYGGADCREGSTTAPPGDAVLGIVRRDAGCTDSNQNGLDFEAAIPLPRNSAYAAAPCGASPPVGACCTAGPVCTILSASACGLSGGHYAGNATACAPSPCTNREVFRGDIVMGMGLSDPRETARQVRGGSRAAGWNEIGWIESVEFDNADGLSHNARGNLLALTFPRLGSSILYQFSTDGSSWRTSLWDFFPTRVVGLSVSPDNQHLAVCSHGPSPVVTFFQYSSGATPGSGLGASVSPWLSVPLPFGSRGSFGTAWLDNTRLLVAHNAGSTVYLSVVNRDSGVTDSSLYLGNFADSGPSVSADVEYNPTISPYVYVLYSLFAGNSETYLSVVDPSFFGGLVLRTISLGASLESGREIALGPDRRLYIAQFGGIGSIGLIDVLPLDLDNNGDVDVDDTFSLTDNSSLDHYREKSAEHAALNTRWSGIDVAVTSVTPPPAESPGSCCMPSPGGCLSLILTSSECAGFGGVFNGPGSTCTLCPEPMGACCDSDGVCTLAFEPECEDTGRLYFGDGSVCTPSACPGPGACCSPAGVCSVLSATACYTAGGRFRGVGASCSPPCAPEPPTLITTFDFDGLVAGVGRNLSFSASPSLPGGLYTGPTGLPYHKFSTEKDLFGVAPSDSTFILADSTLVSHPQDVFGLSFNVLDVGACFAAADMDNRVLNEAGVPTTEGGTGDGFGSAEWLFNVSGSSEFFVSIDFAALGLFDGAGPGGVPDRFVFSYQLDGLPATPAPLFVVEPMDPARPYFCVMARGTKARYELGPDLRGPLAANGIELRNVPTRVMARLNACGPASTLRLVLEASTDGERKVFAFDNIRVLGGECAPQTGSCCNGAQCAVTLEAQCGGVFRLGDTCDVATTRCCPADFNRSGTLTVQDLFEFFAAYFSGSPSGDFNRSGNTTVQDIFDFLAAYFAGCP